MSDNYTPYVVSGQHPFGVQTCLRCGAAILVSDHNAQAIHDEWHQKLDAKGLLARVLRDREGQSSPAEDVPQTEGEKDCPDCGGTGFSTRLVPSALPPCPTCSGTGKGKA